MELGAQTGGGGRQGVLQQSWPERHCPGNLEGQQGVEGNGGVRWVTGSRGPFLYNMSKNKVWADDLR